MPDLPHPSCPCLYAFLFCDSPQHSKASARVVRDTPLHPLPSHCLHSVLSLWLLWKRWLPLVPYPTSKKKKKKSRWSTSFFFLFYPEARDQYLHSKEDMILQGLFQMDRSFFSKQHENLLHSALLNNILTLTSKSLKRKIWLLVTIATKEKSIGLCSNNQL